MEPLGERTSPVLRKTIQGVSVKTKRSFTSSVAALQDEQMGPRAVRTLDHHVAHC